MGAALVSHRDSWSPVATLSSIFRETPLANHCLSLHWPLVPGVLQMCINPGSRGVAGAGARGRGEWSLVCREAVA